MTTTFIEDSNAEQGKNLWTASNPTVTYDSTTARKSGPSSWKCDSGAGNNTARVSRNSVAADAGTRFSGYFRPNDSSLGASVSIIDFHTSRLSVYLTTALVLNVVTNGGATVLKTGSTLSSATWYRISVAYVITAVDNYTVKVWLDGVLDMTVTQADGNLSATGTNNLRVGWNQAPGANKIINFQHIYVDDSSALTDPGDIRATSKRPNANGTTNGFDTQIGSGGSGYGSGHSPQVNERPLSTTNGWSVVGAGSAVTEEYNIENASTGDIDLTGATLVDYMGWVYAKPLVTNETGQIILNGATSNISLLAAAAAAFLKFAGSTTYPAGTGADIGVITSTDLITVQLFEAGIVFAYIPAVTAFDPTITVGSQGAARRGGIGIRQAKGRRESGLEIRARRGSRRKLAA